MISNRIVGDVAASKPVRRWLFAIWGLILIMVMLGGITRLTGSGLSMVEWHPLMGALPPMGDAEWQAVFEKYQRSPQYQKVNHWMQLDDFKRIFFWEYLHRLFGRLIGVAFAVPWLYFLLRRRLDRRLARGTLVAFVLGGLQGLLGWYMVLSGLVEEPRVSHLRLAAHLLLAFVTGMWVLWLALGLGRAGDATPAASRPVRRAIQVLVALLLLQTVYGAFMAGTRAGLYYATFPDMNGAYLPGRFFFESDLVANLLYNPSAIHWIHRFLGWLILAGTVGLWAYLYRSTALRWLTRAGALVAVLGVIQFNLGAFTVVYRVPISLAVAHQAMAYLLLSAAFVLWHRARGREHPDGPGQAAVGDGGVARSG